MKKCPFCKTSISKSHETCPNCGRVIIEKSFTSTNRSSQTSANQDIPEYLNDFGKYFRNFFFKFKSNILVFVVIALIGWWVSIDKLAKYNNKPISVLPNEVEVLDNVDNASVVSVQNPKSYISLETGTTLGKTPKKEYFKGFGELLIDNGSDSDAVAKLVSISASTSVYTVYIKAHTTYKIDKISDGKYKLFFNLGSNWSENKFTVSNQYEVFEENFDFITMKSNSDKYINTEYTTFEITLNPVMQGKAQTNEVEPTEFANY